MKAKIILSIVFSLLAAPLAFAEMHIYMYSSAQMSTDELRVKDIAFVDGPEDECSSVREIVIGDILLTDTYVDRRELSLLLRKHGIENFFIYGSSAKVSSFFAADISNSTPAIKSGDKVKVVVTRKNIKLELTGSALKNANIGDRVVVRCGDKRISGTVKGQKTVMCEI